MFRISKASVKIISEFRIKSHKTSITKKGLILEKLHSKKVNTKKIWLNLENPQAVVCLLNQHDEINYIFAQFL